MNTEVERLLEGLADLREDRSSIGPHHPKCVEWVGAVRQCLRQADDRAALDRFEILRVSRFTNAVWRREELPREELRGVLAELDELEGLLRKVARAADPTERKPLTGTGPAPEQPGDRNGTGDPSGPRPGEPTVTQNTDISGSLRPIQPNRAKTMDAVLADLGEQRKRPDRDLTKNQQVMGDLLELEKTGDLMEKALSAAAEPGARWDSVRAPLAQLWTVNREIVLDLLPALLKKS